MRLLDLHLSIPNGMAKKADVMIADWESASPIEKSPQVHDMTGRGTVLAVPILHSFVKLSCEGAADTPSSCRSQS